MNIIKKQAYLQIDFLFVFLSFLALFSFTYFSYSTTYDNYKDSLSLKQTKEELSLICNTLSLTPGSPKNWQDINISSTNFFGLRDNTSLSLSQEKFESFFNRSNFLEIYDFYNFSSILYIILKNSSGSIIATQGEYPTDYVFVNKEKCFISNQSNLLELEVGVWQ